MVVLQGKSASKGVAIGKLCFYKRGSGEIVRTQVEDTGAEVARFESARMTAIDQLKGLYEKAVEEVGEEGAMLFEAHQMMLDDLDFVEGITDLISDGLNAEAAVSDVSDQLAEMFASMDDAYMQARSADVKDIAQRVINILSGASGGGMDSDEPVILASDDFSPSETVQLDKSKLLGLLTTGGSDQAHTAILARTMGIPSVCQLGEELSESFDGKDIIINGQTGEVFIAPDEETTERLTAIYKKEQA